LWTDATHTGYERGDGTSAGASAAGTDVDWKSRQIAIPLPFGHQTLWFDQETGKYNNLFRIYDPLTGRFHQRDPNETGLLVATAMLYNAQGASALASFTAGGQHRNGPNLYQYLGSNPINRTDPSGLFAFLDIAASTGMQSQLGGMYGDLMASTLDALKGVILFANERNAVIDQMLGMESNPFDFAGIERAVGVYDAFQTASLGMFGAGAGFKLMSKGRELWQRYVSRAGGRGGLLDILSRGTNAVRRLFGFSGEAPGVWARVNESMSARAAAYQARITGRLADEAYVVNGVRFDGFDGTVLLEAKGPGLARMVDKGWFTGMQGWIEQAKRQADAAPGYPIQWHVAEPEVANALRQRFKADDIAIDVIHTP
jgi:RHS repeat-associated protein